YEILDKGLSCDKKVEQELEVLKNITNKILAPRKDTLISENNDSSTPIVSASVDETTCKKVQEGPRCRSGFLHDQNRPWGRSQKGTEESTPEGSEQSPNMMQPEENNMTKLTLALAKTDGTQNKDKLAILIYENPRENNLLETGHAKPLALLTPHTSLI
ncbi:42626_t:CDS:2, partial [Gigaspora margarita]